MVSPRLPWSPPPRYKTCRYCFERIPGEAEVCPSCGETVVRVPPAMVKSLLIVLIAALFILAGQALYHRLADDSGEIANGGQPEGAALGGEMGARQAGLDFSRRVEPRPDNPPDQIGIFLKGKSEVFREGFKREYAEAYRRTYEAAKLARPVQP